MPDVFTKAKRSEVMSRIRGRGNKDTELALAKLLRSHGITGWRRNQLVLGKPDFVFPHECVAVFVDGCFWHGCPKHSNPKKWVKKNSMRSSGVSRRGAESQRTGPSTTLRTGKIFWREKMAANITRDWFVSRTLRRQGWRVVRIYECGLARHPELCLKRIHAALSSAA
jgi:DNA mismatch endonuclease (patch repair protein)